jgi:YfiH family protein
MSHTRNSPSLVLEDKGGYFLLSFFESYHVRAIVTTRTYDMAFEESCSREPGGHRRQVYQKLGLNWHNLVCPSQTHGDAVRVVRLQEAGQGVYRRSNAFSATDALITNQPYLPIAVLTADCLSILLFDPYKKVIAVVHAGWRGIKNAVTIKTIERMRETFGIQVCDLMVVLGPCIRPCCYEVKGEFLGYFKTSLIWRGKRLFFDLAGELTRQVLAAGVSKNHILDSRICTSCMNSRFFSYRREGRGAGRGMTAIEIGGKIK